MSRPKKILGNAAAQKRHDEKLKLRRERQREHKTLEMASKAADGQADFQELVEAEKLRMAKTHQERMSVKGSAASPKVTVKARENLTSAFDLMGGVTALVIWGRMNPTEFYRIWARLVPKEAEDNTAALPLETLLTKLAEKESLSVAEAAVQIGEEVLAAAREQVIAEDLLDEGPQAPHLRIVT